MLVYSYVFIIYLSLLLLLLLLIFICQLCQQHLNPPFKKRGESWVKIVKLHPPPLAEVEWLEANYGEDQRETGLAPRKGEGGKRYLGTAWHGHGLAVEHRGWMKPGKSPKIRGFEWENHGKTMGQYIINSDLWIAYGSENPTIYFDEFPSS